MKRVLALAAAAAAVAAGSVQAQPQLSYLRDAQAADLFEIQEAQLMLARSHDPRVRDYAGMIIRDHSDWMKMEAAAAQTEGKPLPPLALNSGQAKALDELRKAPDRGLDRRYIEEEVRSHEELVALHRRFAAYGDHPEIMKVAATVTPVEERHMGLAREIQMHLAW